MNVTQDDILQAIRDAMAALPPNDGPAGITTAEFVEATGVSHPAARKNLVRLLTQGSLEQVKVYRISPLSGCRCKVPGFRPV